MNSNLANLAKEHCDPTVSDIKTKRVPEGMVDNIGKIRDMLWEIKKDYSEFGEKDRINGIERLIDASYDAEEDFKLYCRFLNMASYERYLAEKKTGKRYTERWDD
ncbi:MAG: hypothetical protein HZB68_00630 [Candidatus Aenigmarchaeota archaeon]|nr:hypothetical protein [Candidatus Aenigmarchaeota archaeon]